jgi:hypothetical protein
MIADTPGATNGGKRVVDSIESKPTPTRSEMNCNAAPLRVGFVSLFILSYVMTPIAIGQVQSDEEFICTFGSDKRMVSVVKADAAREPKSCRVDYTRNGRTTTVWSSKTGYAYCVAKAASLVTKLAEGHYSCKPQSVGAPDESRLERHNGSLSSMPQ